MGQNATARSTTPPPPIRISDRVHFLTKGQYRTKSGFVIRFSKNNEGIFAIDCYGNEIARAPENLRVKIIQYVE